ncbi:hypothetical protein SASPL_151976 [Salvia splendens]|uniref:VQ domain-containing protein n=1 Tax=Salvia splendens TaxID=180675 RepID=A0A8X8YZK0_SALSN|nr:uncharacterized protein LOC121783897 [Salvia splendens]KAG6386802.1 hypothetical protein SASPL_151976 [Salvia splendens]
MESYSSESSSSASYSFSSHSSTHFPLHRQRGKPAQNFRTALAVRKPAITKKPIAPLPPTPAKIYKVEPVEFKEVVQRLTGAVEIQATTRLREVAPPPLDLSPPHWPKHGGLSFDQGENEEEKRMKSFDVMSPLGFSLSPASLAWCSAMLLSPGTLASFEPSAVL